MAICLPTYWAAILLKVSNPVPVNDRWTTQPWPLSKRASADLTSFPVMSAGPSESRPVLAESDEPLRIGSTTEASGLSSLSGVVGTFPVSPAGAVVGVVAGAVVAVVVVDGAAVVVVAWPSTMLPFWTVDDVEAPAAVVVVDPGAFVVVVVT